LKIIVELDAELDALAQFERAIEVLELAVP